jgi:hypothetical protein
MHGDRHLHQHRHRRRVTHLLSLSDGDEVSTDASNTKHDAVLHCMRSVDESHNDVAEIDHTENDITMLLLPH